MPRSRQRKKKRGPTPPSTRKTERAIQGGAEVAQSPSSVLGRIAASVARRLAPNNAHSTPTIPSPLYKYLKREFAEALLGHGTVRLGTLRDYRDEERLGSTIGDRGEGTATLFDNTPHIISGYNEPRGGPYRQLIGPLAPGVEFIGCSFEMPRRAPNSWLYCVSARASKALLHEFDADVCVVIRNPHAFFRALKAAVSRAKGSVEMIVACCDYSGRTQNYSERGEVMPELLKEPRYASQAEVRGIYRPMRADITPFVIDVPELMEYCAITRIPP